MRIKLVPSNKMGLNYWGLFFQYKHSLKKRSAEINMNLLLCVCFTALDVFFNGKSPKFSSPLASLSFQAGPDFGLFSVSVRRLSIVVISGPSFQQMFSCAALCFLSAFEYISPAINLKPINRNVITVYRLSTSPLFA